MHNHPTVNRNFQLAKQMVGIVFDNIINFGREEKYLTDPNLERLGELIKRFAPNMKPNDCQLMYAAAIFISEFTDFFLEDFFNSLWEYYK